MVLDSARMMPIHCEYLENEPIHPNHRSEIASVHLSQLKSLVILENALAIRENQPD